MRVTIRFLFVSLGLVACPLLGCGGDGGSDGEGGSGGEAMGGAGGAGGMAGSSGSGGSGGDPMGGSGGQGGGDASFDFTDGDGEAELTDVPGYAPDPVSAEEAMVTISVPVDSDTTDVLVRVGYPDSGAYAIRGSGSAQASMDGSAETVDVEIMMGPGELPARDDYFAEVWVCSSLGEDAEVCTTTGTGRNYFESDETQGTYMYMPFDDEIPTTRYHTEVPIAYFSVE